MDTSTPSIYPSSLATVLLLLPSAPGRTAAHLACIVFHYTAFTGFLGPSRRLHASARTSRYYHLHSLSDQHAPCPPIHTSRVREQESKHPADFSKQPDNGAHNDDNNNDEGPRPSGSGGASSASQPSGSSGGTMGGNAIIFKGIPTNHTYQALSLLHWAGTEPEPPTTRCLLDLKTTLE
ncbi:uncharacterized protein FOMMEDRAFT_151487 [Fomitiporia mediterranea MF3/22]|uniref:uncharacterized protein n=1 Tax=Fomitiporia mediterranea (strain MF3/22) TaxID=694068 RepID=UPI0004408D68|nr:uncharacterized protein FOMMEDRAFT_151487 [Fomitiporia mediterranea MF3/22]EJD08602.1 hypothetical protein FOMMEDRAFT_151487 [Fomitiporia mediterranea MF3/22]